MKALTQYEVDAVVKAQKEYSKFSPEDLNNFIQIWKLRLNDALLSHKREDLAQLARSVITFAETATPGNLGLYVCNSEEFGSVGFLYDDETHKFLQIGERKIKPGSTPKTSSPGSPRGS